MGRPIFGVVFDRNWLCDRLTSNGERKRMFVPARVAFSEGEWIRIDRCLEGEGRSDAGFQEFHVRGSSGRAKHKKAVTLGGRFSRARGNGAQSVCPRLKGGAPSA